MILDLESRNLPKGLLVQECKDLRARVRELERVLALVSTDIAQDILEDPCGSHDRAKSGFVRLTTAVLPQIRTALAQKAGET